MAHPLIPQLLELATPVAESLGLEVVGAVFHTNQSPPVLRVDVRNLQQDTGLDDCERMSRALEAALDATDLIPDHYVLEVSSPGTARELTSDREFIAFRGFTISVTTTEPYHPESTTKSATPKEKGHQTWKGKLIRRDDTTLYLNQKGRTIALPRPLVAKVELDND